MAVGPSRKLAVILHADVVGSTTLVQQNETLAHARIQDAFRRFSLTIEAYDGVTHELRGDALVAEFARASDAASAGLAFQIENTESNARLVDDLQPQLRIGISLGEVVIADSTVTGAGVVLAQRVEQLAEPGGVCITGAVHEAVPQHLPLYYSDLGKREVKGFEEPVQVYSASVKAGKQIPSPEHALSRDAHSRKPKHLWTASAIVLLILVVGAFAWWQPWVPREEPASIERMAFPLPDKPSIAVLPFTNMSDDLSQEYFVDGMTDDLITDLSKLSGLFVIARNSTFTYKGKSVEVQKAAEELGVRYVLEGSVRRAGEQVRINAQLIDATTGGHLWAERYDGSLADVFDLQDRVTKRIVTALAIKLSPVEEAALEAGGTANLEAYEAFVRGVRANNATGEIDFESNDKALREFQRAIDLDPTYALAYGGLAWAYWLRFSVVTNTDWKAKAKALELAKKSLDIGENSLAYRVLAKQYLAPRIWNAWGDDPDSINFDAATGELRKAVALEPSNADGLAELAFVQVFAGMLGEAAELMDKAKRLNPNFPDWYHQPAGIAYYLNGEYERAIGEFNALYSTRPWSMKTAFLLVAAYAQAGNLTRARDLVEAVQKQHNITRPYYLQQFSNKYPFKKDEHLEMFLQGLRKAGVPDLRG